MSIAGIYDCFMVFLGVALLILWIFAILDVIATPQDRVRNLPKLVWLLLVVVLTDVGSIAWFLLGRPRAATRRTNAGQSSSPGRARSSTPAPMNEDSPDFMREMEKRRRRAEQERRTEEDPGL